MATKLNETLEWRFHSDLSSSFARYRDRQALLRSSGHRFRDGRWEGEETDFHQYGVVESPGFGKQRTFDGSAYWRSRTEIPFDSESHVQYNWRPVVGREFTFFDGDTDVTIVQPEPEDPAFSDSVLALNNNGTSFIKRKRPGNPAADVGQFLIELRELPRVPILQDRVKHLRDVGSEYLNIEFGWRPLLNDIKKLAALQLTLQDRLRRLVKDNGISRRIRSKKRGDPLTAVVAEGVFTPVFGHLGSVADGGSSELDSVYCLGPFPYFDPNPGFTGQTAYKVTQTNQTVDWECGTFRYYVPNIGSSEWTERAINALYDVNVTPSVLWSVYPWSWLIDWFSNVGDIISNLSSSAVDNETLTNCFAMREVITTRKVECWPSWDTLDFAPYNPEFHFDLHAFVPAGSDYLSYVYDTDEKLRHQATPFGFGFDMSNCTVRQLAILAALAISRK